MTDTIANNKRIAKNTLMLYIRMLATMLISLYTSRVILNSLGIEDFGIYNVVAGAITMMNFLSSSMATATQRYMNYAMGKNDTNSLSRIFSTSYILFIFIAIISIIIAETIGLWFISTKLTIPTERYNAAFWIYQISIITFVINLLSTPYNAAIIANEKMSAFAYISILEVTGKLATAFLINTAPIDKLIYYGILIAIISIIIRLTYSIYCKTHFKECKKIIWKRDKELAKSLLSFSGWMLSGTITNILSTQGVNILINMFFGPALNAARAIAVQINAAVRSFSENFMTAVRPQIIKSFSQNDLNYTYNLVIRASNFSFYLLLILSTPILCNTERILNLWLKSVPDFTVIFTQLVLVDLLINSSYSPIAYISQAANKIAAYQSAISIGFALIAILTWLFYKLGFPPETTFIITIIIDIIGLFVRLLILKKIVSFPVKKYFTQVTAPNLCIFILAMLISFLPKIYIGIDSSLSTLILFITYNISATAILVWLIGLNSNERHIIKIGIHKFIKIKQHD